MLCVVERARLWQGNLPLQFASAPTLPLGRPRLAGTTPRHPVSPLRTVGSPSRTTPVAPHTGPDHGHWPRPRRGLNAPHRLSSDASFDTGTPDSVMQPAFHGGALGN